MILEIFYKENVNLELHSRINSSLSLKSVENYKGE